MNFEGENNKGGYLIMDKILLVEDDNDIREMLIDYLGGEGYLIEEFGDSLALKNWNNFDQYKIALVDLMLPHGSGFDVIKKIRKKSTIPIIIITAKNSDHDKTMGLALGADDYVTKPFSIVELSARIKANLRRVLKYDAVMNIKEEIIILNDLEINLSSHEVMRNNEYLNLTYTEFEILSLLAKNRGRAFSKEQIYQYIWKETYYGNENVLNSHMNRLRNKLKIDHEDNTEYIKTLWGIGYKIEIEEEKK